MARRTYQSGCLFKRGKRRKVWVARWREDVIDAEGRPSRIHRSIVLGSLADLPTQREARALLEQRLRSLNSGRQAPLSTARFSDFVETTWKPLILPTLKLSTQRGYRMVLGRHLLPFFGDRRLNDITKVEVQQYVTEKFRQNLAWQTVRNSWIVLSSILDSAVDFDRLSINPARGVKFPPQPLRAEPVILTGESFSKLLGELKEPYRTMVALLGLTGLRIGELIALRWRALDLDVGTLQVRESVFQGQVQQPKSQRAIRTVPLGPVACRTLREHLERRRPSSSEALVFPNERGGPHSESNLIQRVLRPAAVAAGLGRVTFHQMRHVHSSILHDLKVPPKIAQQQLGHATVDTTLRIYTHVIEGSHRKAIEDLEGVLFPNVPKLAGERRGTAA